MMAIIPRRRVYHSAWRSRLFCAFVLATTAAQAQAPARIVSFSPSITEILYGVGAFHRLVGVAEYSSYPPEAKSLPVVGNWPSPNLEKLIALRPDLVILGESQAPFVQDRFRDLRIPTLITPTGGVADILEAIALVGRATGREAQAAKLAASVRAALDATRRKTKDRPRARVVIVIDRTPGTLRELYTATEGSFLAELIEIAGGHVVAPPAPSGYRRIAAEELLVLNPDVILDFQQGANTRFAGNPLDAWNDMPELKAVRERRVYSVQENYVPHDSQRITLTAELFARLIHPEIK
jgi:iron complex transport system substrate-binding protein